MKTYIKVSSLAVMLIASASTLVNAQNRVPQDVFRDANLAVEYGNYPAAIQAYETIRTTKPRQFSSATAHIGTTLYIQGKYGEAIVEYEKLLAMDPRKVMNSAVADGLVSARLCAIRIKQKDSVGLTSALGKGPSQQKLANSKNTTARPKAPTARETTQAKIDDLVYFAQLLGKVYDIEGRDLLYKEALRLSGNDSTLGYQYSRALAGTQQFLTAINILKGLKSPSPKSLQASVDSDLRHYQEIVGNPSWPKQVVIENTRSAAKFRKARLSNFNVIGI